MVSGLEEELKMAEQEKNLEQGQGNEQELQPQEAVTKPKKDPIKRGKLIIAKDMNQLILAVVVMGAFFANTVYMLVKYFIIDNKIS